MLYLVEGRFNKYSVHKTIKSARKKAYEINRKSKIHESVIIHVPDGKSWWKRIGSVYSVADKVKYTAREGTGEEKTYRLNPDGSLGKKLKK